MGDGDWWSSMVNYEKYGEPRGVGWKVSYVARGTRVRVRIDR